MSRLFEQHKLPSNGMLEGVPREVTIQNMTTAEEKMLIGSSEELYDTLITKCVTEPENFDFDSLILADQQFLLIRIRSMSYGSEYPYSYRCPNCGQIHEYMLDLDSFETTYLEDGFTEPYARIPLPVSKDIVGLRLPRVSDINSIETKTRRHMKKNPQAQGDIGYIFNLMANISEIELDGDKTGPKLCNVPIRGDMTKYMSEHQLQDYVENLHVRDAAMIKNTVAKQNNAVGMDRTVYEVCPNCQSDIEFTWNITSDFFRSRVGE